MNAYEVPLAVLKELGYEFKLLEEEPMFKHKFLKVKLKSLAEEARIIRKEEKKEWGETRSALHDHRVVIVRNEARLTHIAYAFVRGKTARSTDQGVRPLSPEDWKKVTAMCKKYGSADFRPEDLLPWWLENLVIKIAA